MISNEELKKLKSYLKHIKDFSEKEDWSETYAQALVFDGAFLYDKIFNEDTEKRPCNLRIVDQQPNITKASGVIAYDVILISRYLEEMLEEGHPITHIDGVPIETILKRALKYASAPEEIVSQFRTSISEKHG